MADWQIDRSRVIDYQMCPRKRYWGFHHNGTGIQRKSKSLPLVFGGAFHEGIGSLISPQGSVWADPALDTAVAIALQFIDQAFLSKGIDLGEDEKISLYALNEQKAIAESLIRGWWAYEGEMFLRDFEVLEVEQEGRAEMGDRVTLLFRPDAVVRERQTGDVYVVSWKTESMHGQWSMQRASTDMQSMSEVWGWINKPLDYDSSDYRCDLGLPLRIEGTLYKWAVKGQRRMDDYLGFKVQDTPLAYGWTRKLPDGSTEWAWRYKWASDEPGRTWEQLPKGFRKVSIWDNYPGGVKAWVEALAGQTVRPFHLNALEGVFPQALPVSRRADEIESWRRQVVGQESRVEACAAILVMVDENIKSNGENPQEHAAILDQFFPQHTHSCYAFNSRCQFYDTCFTPAVGADPLGSGLYQIRVSNHPEKGDEE